MAREKPKEKQNPKNPDIPRDLKWLQRDTEKSLPEGIEELLLNLEERKRRIQADSREFQHRTDERSKARIEENNLLILDIEALERLAVQHERNPNVQRESAELNRIYRDIFGTEMPPELQEEKSEVGLWRRIEIAGDGLMHKAKSLFTGDETREDLADLRAAAPTGALEERYVAQENRVDDALDAAQTKHVVEMAATGNRDAIFETYVTSKERYRELASKILKLPKDERDKNLDKLLANLDFYDSLRSEEFQKEISRRLQGAAEQILKDQQAKFTGLRGFIQKGVEKGLTFAVDHFSGVVGDEDSVARNLFIWAAHKGIDLSKPVQYSPELVQQFADETIEQVSRISGFMDGDAVSEMRKATLDAKANPDYLMKQDDQDVFMGVFDNFFRATVDFHKNLIGLQTELLTDAYIASHGKKSEFEGDSEGRARFFQIQGRDVIRTLRVYSPFGMFLPAQVERKGDQSPVALTSAYDQGWFKDHSIMSLAAQSAGFGVGYYALRYVAPRVASYLPAVGLPTRILRKVLGKPVSKLAPIAGQILLGYELGNEINEMRMSAADKEALKILNKYDLMEEMPESEREKLRILVLKNEIGRRKKLFQDAGYDLDRFNMSLLDQFSINAMGGFGMFDDDMITTGTFREAVLAANRKLVLIGFKPFEIR